jgi:hypothetical protein
MVIFFRYVNPYVNRGYKTFRCDFHKNIFSLSLITNNTEHPVSNGYRVNDYSVYGNIRTFVAMWEPTENTQPVYLYYLLSTYLRCFSCVKGLMID